VGGEQRRAKGLRLRAIAATANDANNDDGGGGDRVLHCHRTVTTHPPPNSCGVVKRDAARRQNHTPLSESVTE